MKISKKSVLAMGSILTMASFGLIFVSAAWNNPEPDVNLEINPSNAIQHFQNVKIIATGNTDDSNATISKDGELINIATDNNFTISANYPNAINKCDFNSDGIITVEEINQITACISSACNNPIYDSNDDGYVNITDSSFCVDMRNKRKPANKTTRGVKGSSILGGFGNKIIKGIYETILGGKNNKINSGDSNSILGGEDNTIGNGTNSVIFGGKSNVISGVYGRDSSIIGGSENIITMSDSTIVGNRNTVNGQNSIALGSKAKVSGKYSFLWSDGKVSELSGDYIFAVIGDNGMVINSTGANSIAQLSISGSLIVYDDKNAPECTNETKGVLKVITGDIYNSNQECFCSCDGNGRNALHEGTRCASLCAIGTGLEAECGGAKINCDNNPYLYTGDDTSGACTKGELVGGTGAFFVTTNKVGNTLTDYINRSCETADGHVTQCKQKLTESCPNIQTGYECMGTYENVTGHIIINEEKPTNSATFWKYDTELRGPCTYKCDEYGEWDAVEEKCIFHACTGELLEGAKLNNEIALPMNDTTEFFYDTSSTGACAYSCQTEYGYFYSGALNKCITCPEGQVYDERDETCKIACDINNTDFETITVMDASGYAITIADRNLGATSNGTGELTSYGCYFQWGNNYGFQPIGILQTGTDFVDTSSYGPLNPYSSEIFRVRSGEMSIGRTPVYGPNDDDWSYPANHNLWGGGEDSNDNAFGVLDTNKQNRQGPCPEGYHVPSIGERNDLLIMWYNNQYKDDGDEDLQYIKDSGKIAKFNSRGNDGLETSESIKLVSAFRDYFMLPTASSRGFLDFTPGITYGKGGSFWTSSSPWQYNSFSAGSLATNDRINSNPNNANSFDYDIESRGGYVGAGTAGRKMSAQSVRCFKDEPECPSGKTRNPSLLKCEGILDCDMENTAIQDLELFFISSTGEISHYTMMDRNLGALDVFNQKDENAQNKESYGCHFQWGNNYGFYLGSPIRLYGVDPSGYGPGNYYSNNKFYCYYRNNTNNSELLEDIPEDEEDNIIYGSMYSPINYHMWGGGYINWSNDFIKGTINGSDIDRQGPCPEGYHVPGGIEMKNLVNKWNNASASQGAIGKNFSSDLLMPYGRYIEVYCGDQNKLKKGGGIWLSDKIYYRKDGAAHGTYANHISKFTDTSEIVFGNNGYAHGFPVRCVKNGMTTTDQKITIHPDGGTGAVIAIDWESEGSGKITALGKPQKNGIKFLGWYSDELFTNQVNTGDYIANGGHLYAKWNECKINETKVQDLEIYLLSSAGAISHYTMMDRNLGAKEVFNQSFSSPNESSYGCYFQWGNNYGFPKVNKYILTTNETLEDPENYGPGRTNGYYLNPKRFCYTGDQEMPMYPRYNSYLYKNFRLWGGGRARNGEFSQGNDGTDIDRRGPCPEGYHIPKGREMENIINEWKNSSASSGYGPIEATKFASNLLLPFAGYNEVTCGLEGQGSWNGGGEQAEYNISDYRNDNNHIHIGTDGVIFYQNGPAHGLSMRCVKNNISDNQKITIEANGGTGAVITIDWETEGTGKIVALTDPKKGTSRFLGRYSDSSFINRVYSGDYISDGDHLYAKWNNCNVEETAVKDLELFFISNTGTISHYMMMDRNLGANEVFNKSSTSPNNSSYGCYFQWGNNYGFDRTNYEKLMEQVDITGYGPDNYYSSNKFLCNRDDWTVTWFLNNSNYADLRGGITNTDISKRGPCPEGYHIPNTDELQNMVKSWNSSTDTTGGTQFKKDTLIPPAGVLSPRCDEGYRSSSTDGGSFWTVSRRSNAANTCHFLFSLTDICKVNGVSHGFPVRCVKNNLTTSPQKVTIHPDGGTGAVIVIDWETEGSGKIMTLGEPTKNGYSFGGWFSNSGLTVNVNIGDSISSGGNLYAKWIAKDCNMETMEIKDLELFFLGSTGEISHYTIMDRNLGAFEVYNQKGNNLQNSKSNGCHFQWGNNYGFTLNPETTIIQVDPTNYGPSSYYSDKFYCYKSGVNSEKLYNPQNYHMWGGGYINSNGSYRYGSDGSDTDRRGPCPEGYHIPSGVEMDKLINKWNDASISQGKNGDKFYSDLLIPYGRYLEVSCENQKYLIKGGGFWISDHIYENYGGSGGGFYANRLGYLSAETNVQLGMNGMIHGMPVRCVKNGMEDTPQKITIHANGGTEAVIAIDWESEGSGGRIWIGNVLFTRSGGSGKIMTLGTPTKAGFEFLGWYSDEGFNNLINTGDYISSGGHLYAKWNEPMVQDLDIYILGETGDISRYMMMDRNLGATEIYNQDYSSPNKASYGYHYQWGNNYGFPNEGDITTSSTPVDVSSYGPGNYYSNSTFIMGNVYWALPMNHTTDNLWGNTTNTSEARQGPCPVGYHIPTKNEWVNIYNNWNSTNIVANNKGIQWASDLLMPFAGSRDNDTSSSFNSQNHFGNYRSSTPFPSDFSRAHRLSLNSININPHDFFPRAGGFSIRCFKNSIDIEPLTIHANEGTGAVITIDWGTGGTGKVIALSEPKKQGYIFDGWYLDRGFTNKVNTGDYISSGGHLYAKWTNPIAIFTVGNTFNDRIKSSYYGGSETNIRSIIRSYSEPSGVRTGLLSDTISPIPIIFRYKDGTIYYYTEAEKIYLNENSEKMFEGLSRLTNLDMSGWDTSNVSDTSRMFYGCKSLSNLDLSNFNTSNVTNMNSMFYGCSNLSNLNLSGWNTSNVTDMNSMFYNCSNFTALDLSNFNTSNVTNMNSMFYGCSNLSNLNLSGWNTSNVTDMNSMFRGCSSLTNLNLSGWNTSNVTDMNSMFRGCSKLSNLELNHFNTNNVINMSSMFQGCSGLNNLNINGWNTTNVTNMSSMFYDCSNLTSLNLAHFHTNNVTNMSSMFNGCSKLSNLNLNEWDTSNVTNMGAMFHNCSSLTGLDITHFHTNNVTNMSSMFYGCSSLKNIDVTHFNTSNVTNMSSMFYNCSSLTGIDVTHFDTSNVTDMTYMFRACTSLLNLDVTHFDTSNVENMDGMFRYCNKLTNLDVTHFDTSNVTDMSEMFYMCSNLTNIDVSHFNTSNVENMSDMFQGCSKLTNLDLSHFDTSNVTDMSSMFYGCSKLSNLNTSGWNTSNVDSMTYMFKGCSSFTNLDLSHFNTSKVQSMSEIFNGCTNLTNLNVSNWDTTNTRSLYQAFLGCKNLTNLDLSNWDTRDMTDMRGMFSNATNLEAIYVGPKFRTDNVKIKDSSGMFYNDINLVGGNGTTYDPNFTDKTYARIDTGTQLGYFTQTGATNKTVAYLLPGKIFNTTVKSLSIGNTTADKLITKLEKANSLPIGATTITISDTGSDAPIYAWFDNGILYYHTTADIIEANSDLSSMFVGFQNLTEFDFGDWDISNVRNINYMFGGCNNLTKLDLSNLVTDKWNTTNIRSVYNICYSSCDNLTELSLSGWYLVNNVRNEFSYTLGGLLFGGTPPPQLKKIDLSNVKINGGLEEAFKDMDNIEEIILDGIDTSQVTSMKGMFEDCSKLSKIDATQLNISNVTDMNSMFQGCRNLTGLDLSNWDTSNVTDMGGMFYITPNLETIYTSSGFITDQVVNTIYDGLFSNNEKLAGGNGTKYRRTSSPYTQSYTSNIHLDKAKIDNHSQSGYFTDKNEITVRFMIGQGEEYSDQVVRFGDTATAPNTNPSKPGAQFEKWITKDGEEYDFNDKVYKYTELYAKFDSDEAILLPGGEFNITVKNLPYLPTNFINGEPTSSYVNGIYYLKRWTGNTIPSGVYTGIISVPYSDNEVVAWYNSTDHIVYYYTEANTIYLNEDSRYMFYGLRGLKSFNLSDWNTSNVTDMGYMFGSCKSLTNLNLSNWNTSNVTDMGYMFKECSNLSNLDISNFNTSNVIYMAGMFNGCTNLINLDLTHFNTSNVTNMNSMFEECSSLTGIDLTHFNTSNVTNMGYMFNGCSSLTRIDLTHFNTSNVTDMKYMFNGCSGLLNLDLNNFNTNNVTNMKYMFYGCNNLTGVNIGNWNTDNVTNMIGMFYECNSLAELDVSNWNTNNVIDMGGMFYKCSDLAELDVSNWNTNNVTNMYNMFGNCNNLTTIYASTGFVTNKIASNNTSLMFQNDINLVGGNGTTFDISHINKTYARIDQPGTPGYFTLKQ